MLQLLACVFSFLARDGAMATSAGVMASSWLALGLLQLSSEPGQLSSALGLMPAAAAALALSAAAVALAKPLPGFVFSVAALRLALAGIYELSSAGSWRDAAGVAGLVVTAGAAYVLLAFELEGQQRRAVLPTWRLGRGQRAPSGDPDAQVEEVFHEAGVRQTS